MPRLYSQSGRLRRIVSQRMSVWKFCLNHKAHKLTTKAGFISNVLCHQTVAIVMPDISSFTTMKMKQTDNFRLDGKVALVTGSGRGIGAAVAIEFSKRGAKVVINYAHSSEAANKVVEEIKENGSDAIAIKADVSDTAQVVRLMDEAVEHFGQLDIVYSNSGVVSFGHLKDVTEEV